MQKQAAVRDSDRYEGGQRGQNMCFHVKLAALDKCIDYAPKSWHN